MTHPSPSKRTVPIIDLGQEYEAIKKDLTPLLETILRSGSYVLGPELVRFEKDLSQYLGVRHAIGVNSGTDAVGLALKALDIGPGDEVILPAMSFFASVEPIIHLGAKPVFVDIDPVSYGIHVAAISPKITSRTKAILAVHLYGHPADLKGLSQLAKEKKIPLIEDMAQAIGSSYDGKKAGSWGDMACLSFYPTKNLGACGDAGAVLTSSDLLAERIRSLRNHGARVKYHHEEAAYNSRLDEIQAAILRLKLKYLEEWTEKRRTLAVQYHSALSALPIDLPREVPGYRHVFHLYSIQSDRRDDLKVYLGDQGIATGLHYPIPLPLLPALKSLGHQDNDFPVSESLARRTLSLPLYPFMRSEDVLYVAESVSRFCKAHA